MIKWNHRHTLLLTLIALILIVIGYYSHFYLIEPKEQAVAETEARRAYQARLLKINETESLAKEDLKREHEQVELELPKEQAIDQLIIMLDQLTNGSSLIIHRIEQVDEGSRSGSSSYPENIEYINHQIDFSANNYSDVEQFIHELNYSNRRIEIEQLNIQQTSTQSVSGTVVYRAFYSE